jgi:hypothetical protein
MTGLERILQLRGGMKSLRSAKVLRLILFWSVVDPFSWELIMLTISRIDVSGSLIMDTQPRFPPPEDLVEEISISRPSLTLQNLVLTWNVNFPGLVDIGQVLLSLANLATHTNDQTQNPQFWHDEFFLALKVYPLAHALTSLPRYPLFGEEYPEADGFTMREILRITCILFLGLLKKRFEVEPNGIRPNTSKISKLLRFLPVNWSQFLKLRLWVLTISAIVEEGEEREWFVAEIAYTMVNLGYGTWYEALESLKELVWSNEMAANEVNILGQDIEKFRMEFLI